jgi:NAD(P)-dependent dehydrogenase (short-subunit alcohol dehydrogenase family)
MTESLALEFASQGVLVNAVGPGFIDTEMTAQIKENPTMFQSLINRIAVKRFGRPDEIASVVAFLSSEEASYLTGVTIYADGGWTAA